MDNLHVTQILSGQLENVEETIHNKMRLIEETIQGKIRKMEETIRNLTAKCAQYYVENAEIKKENKGLKVQTAMVKKEKDILVEMVRVEKHRVKFFTQNLNEKEKDVANIKKTLVSVVNKLTDKDTTNKTKTKISNRTDNAEATKILETINETSKNIPTVADMTELQEPDNDYGLPSSNDEPVDSKVGIKEQILKLSQQKASSNHVKETSAINLKVEPIHDDADDGDDIERIFETAVRAALAEVTELEDYERVEQETAKVDNVPNLEDPKKQIKGESPEEKQLAIHYDDKGDKDRQGFREMDDSWNMSRSFSSGAEDTSLRELDNSEDSMITNLFTRIDEESVPETYPVDLFKELDKVTMKEVPWEELNRVSQPEGGSRFVSIRPKTILKRKDVPENEMRILAKMKKSRRSYEMKQCSKCAGLCEGFSKKDCDTCRACMDKPRNGGKNTYKQKCYARRCTVSYSQWLHKQIA